MYNNLSDEGEDVNIFTLSDRGVSLSKNTLASIARSQMQARGVDASQLDSNATVWVRYTVADNDKHRSSMKSNVLRAIRKDYLSWGTFQRWVAIARFRSVTFYVATVWEDGVETFSKHVINGDSNFLNSTDMVTELKANTLEVEMDKYPTHTPDLKIQTLLRLAAELKAEGVNIDVHLHGERVDIGNN